MIDPFASIPTLGMICNIQDPITREDYSRDPRNVARKANNYLLSSNIADVCYIGAEAEFFIFDDVRFDQNAHEGYFHLDSVEAEWTRGRALLRGPVELRDAQPESGEDHRYGPVPSGRSGRPGHPVQDRDDRRRNTCRAENPVPRHRGITRQTGFGNRRHIGELRIAFIRRGTQQS